MNKKPLIAVVGIAGVFPGGNSIETFWDTIVHARDLTREPPPGRWVLPLEEAWAAGAPQPDKVYSRRACFVEDFRLDDTGLDLDHGLLEQLDPAFHLLLHAGNQAWCDAGTGGLDRHRAGVIIGNIVLPTQRVSALAADIIGPALDAQVAAAGDRTRRVHRLNRYVAGLPAGILSRALGLGLGCYTLDAACASSLYAVKFAMDELQSGRADAMLAGGLSRPDPLYTQMGFSALHAISPRGHCAPFDHKADGLVVGEGCGMLLLKRLDDARADNDHIYGVLTGAGLSNDIGGNLMSPDSEGQLRAMRQAYRDAGWRPDDIDLIECHGTGTPVGDAVEFNSLRQLWQDQDASRRCVIGSVKSNIGHLLTAAGAAGLIKVLLSLQHETLPPTANFESANPGIDLQHSPFEVLARAAPWKQRDTGTPRRAAVSAFGFGGINAHLLLEQWSVADRHPHQAVPRVREQDHQAGIAIIGMDAAFGPWQGLQDFQRRVFGGDGHVRPGHPKHWWGVGHTDEVSGYFINEIQVPVGRFRIPPTELQDMLPQQLLMLQVAANAMADAGMTLDGAKPDAGVYVGIGLDLNTTNFHLRWTLADRARHWARQRGWRLTPQQFDDWLKALQDTVQAPLSANRTMGALGGIVASRLARAFNVGGPGFTLSSEETSGLRALHAGVRALRAGDINMAIVGAVDLAGDVRAVIGQADARPWSPDKAGKPFDERANGSVIGEGAAAVILKRLDDARRDGDRVYAQINAIAGSNAGHMHDTVPGIGACESALHQVLDTLAGGTPGYLELHGSGFPPEDDLELQALGLAMPDSDTACVIGSVKADIGHAGAAGGLAALVKTSLCLYHHVIPPLRNHQHRTTPLPAHNLFIPHDKQYWLHNRADGPRKALVNSLGVDGNVLCAIVSAADSATVSAAADQTTGLQLFSIQGNDKTELATALMALRSAAAEDSNIATLARAWHRQQPGNHPRLAVSLLAENTSALQALIRGAEQTVAGGEGSNGDGIFYNPAPLGPAGQVAFLFPGSGNHFPGMGRETAAHWPRVLDRLDADNQRLADQFARSRFWLPGHATVLSHRDVIFGQVWLGTMMSDMLGQFGLRPDAVIGYSLGETAALFATRAWTSRDEMLARIENSDLFTDQLAGACRAARQTWGLDPGTGLDWQIGVVNCPVDRLQECLQGREQVYLLIINTPAECVIGGNRIAVQALVESLACQFHAIDGVTTVHCEVVQPVQQAYRDLHLFETNPAPGVRYYSGIRGGAYEVTRDSAADSITGQALHHFDYTRVINNAYNDGVRLFVETGPGATCARMVDRILGDRPHMARAVCVRGQSEVKNVLALLAQLNTERIPVELSSLYEQPPATSHQPRAGKQTQFISVPVGRPSIALPLPEHLSRNQEQPQATSQKQQVKVAELIEFHPNDGTHDFIAQLIEQAGRTAAAQAGAQEMYLQVANGIAQSLGQACATEAALLRNMPANYQPQPLILPAPPNPADTGPDTAAGLFMDRGQCMEFAIGSVARVLGQRYAEADGFPTRVRLPDEPLMLVDRVLEVEGEPCSMSTGKVVTEHDVKDGAWYLDAGRIPTCIAVEAGQADLFLSGYLGIDLQTQGLATYRLLDAEVTFHGPLPTPGQVIHYDIHIDHFFRQGDTWLFRFRFDGTVNGRPLISMRNGCAGFFSHAELDAGQGIVQTALEKRAMTGKRAADWRNPANLEKSSYTDQQVDALRRGDLAACFGQAFAALQISDAAGLPGGRMTLVHRVLDLDPRGGRYGIGSITGEADIHPDDWFLTCHFVDDQVMPGTLMYECCLHTLRIYLLRMGWVGEAGEFVYEPMRGVTGKLKCRGQVIATTSKVQYEITLKEYGYLDDITPYVIADALMYADGRAIVQMTDMSLMLSGLSRQRIESLWQAGAPQAPVAPVLFDHDSILAFATGKPSAAFGERYRVFDTDRVIARLPGPPYQFLDRISAINNCEQWKLNAGGSITAEYDVPPDAWYFSAGRQPDMPFAVLLEVALQPCGWLAAYLGSALTSADDLSFRNLGGWATQYMRVNADTGTIFTNISITNVSQSGGMIIQHYDYELSCAAGPVYRGNTYFGFFTHAALANQVGLRDVQLFEAPQPDAGVVTAFDYPDRPPCPAAMLRMVDRITCFDPGGGPHGLGFISGMAEVDPEAWFFKAHFYQDPVWPGSLGLESFIQLLKIVAISRWAGDNDQVEFETMALNHEHRWTYRGQIIPVDRQVAVQAVITKVDDDKKILTADGFLCVDGRIIYQMNDFTLRIHG